MEYEVSEETIQMDKLVRVYRKMSARIQELTAEYENTVEPIKAQQEQIKLAIKDQMLALGLASVRTVEGTVVMSQKTRYFTQDWDSFKRFVLDHEAVDLLERRVSQLNMAQFLEANPGAVPPGLNSHTEYSLTVKKPTTK
jgi:hypothetical protein